MKRQIRIYDKSADLFESTAIFISDLINNYVKLKGHCTFVLSGGSTPKQLYGNLATRKINVRIPWRNVYFFWGDERCVSPDDDESNYKMAFDNLLSKVGIPSINIFRILSEMPHAYAALEYESKLKEFFQSERIPSFDILLLGLGEDGHTASLFEGTQAVSETERWLIDNFVEKLGKWRITMTFPILNNSKTIIFLVKGKSKAKIVNSIIKDKNKTLPAARIKQKKGNLIWCMDNEAAILIKQ